jgi:hypothetical protein
MSERLSSQSMMLEQIAVPQSSSILYRLQPTVILLTLHAIGNEVYETGFIPQRTKFEVLITEENRFENLISNPSFEISLEDWNGPGQSGTVTLSPVTGLFGNSAMKMELAPSVQTDQHVRRTFTVNGRSLVGEHLVARANINIESLSDATAELRLYFNDSDGNSISVSQINAGTPESAPGYQQLVLNVDLVPEGTTSIGLQLAVVPVTRGGNGVVFWDGIELYEGANGPQEYCDGDQVGCTWIGAQHQSQSAFAAVIQELTVVTAAGEETFDGPFTPGDKFMFDNGDLLLARTGGLVKQLSVINLTNDDRTILLRMVANELPIITLSEYGAPIGDGNGGGEQGTGDGVQ